MSDRQRCATITIDLISRLRILGIGWLVSKQSSQPTADTWLAFCRALTRLLLLFGGLSRRLRIGEFALGLRLCLPRGPGVRPCLFRFLIRPSDVVLCLLEIRLRIGKLALGRRF
jgi:hypothetical protein